MREKLTRCRLIVFLKLPIEGKVKTRLAHHLGPSVACQVYRQLVTRQLHEVKASKRSAVVYFAPEKRFVSSLSLTGIIPGFEFHPQKGEDLGQRICQAFVNEYRGGFDRIIVIGTDCPSLSADEIRKAFERLGDTEAVIGPTRDGGYYLLGLNFRSKPFSNIDLNSVRDALWKLFEGIRWSRRKVFQQTCLRLKQGRIRFSVLSKKEDIDVRSDLNPANLNDLYPTSLDRKRAELSQ